MRRILAAGAAAALLGIAGLFWWGSKSGTASSLLPTPAFAQTEDHSEQSDPPQAGASTREEKRFDRYDKDRDSAITRDEYLANRRKAYARLDLNGDGQLSFDEWSKKTVDKFAKADADSSGKLDRPEFATTKVVRKAKPKPDCPPTKEEEES